MNRLYVLVLFFVLMNFSGYGQASEGFEKNRSQVYINTSFHEVDPISNSKGKLVKNIILMIGDGMGFTQVQAGYVANKGSLNIQNCNATGLSRTRASDELITDSAAAGTAMACGIKTYNGAIGVDSLGLPIPSILKVANAKGLKTGMVATCRITHATPASFIAHQPQRYMYQAIALDFLNTPIDVFIGGGREDFNQRKDGRDLLNELKNMGYQIVTNTDSLSYIKGGKLAGLIHESDQPRFTEGRGDMLGISTRKSIELLDNPDGFFLMIEGSQIDWGGHANELDYMVEEMLDFDKVIGEVLSFAAADGETLVVITADHETGGFAITEGNPEVGAVAGTFSTGGHTPVMVPVYAYGPKAELFRGTYQNTEIYSKMVEAFGF